MKYLIKFNESDQGSVLTKEFFEKIENLFLDWEFEVFPRDIEHQLPLTANSLKTIPRRNFLSFYVYPLGDEGPLELEISPYEKKWWLLDGESLKEIGAVSGKIKYPRINSIRIEKMSDIDRLFKSNPSSPKYCQLFIFLDKHYNLQESLKGLMYRTKGVKHYGFDFEYHLRYEIGFSSLHLSVIMNII